MILECLNIGRRFRNRWALKEISFNLLDGRSLLIAGPSGSGKSTLINLLSGFLSPTEGDLFVRGYCIRSNYEQIKSLISCVWSESSIFHNMSIVDNLRFFSMLNGQDKKQADAKRIQLMRELGVYHERTKLVKNLSSGLQRKVDLCRALINNSKLFLFDEPSSLLDNRSKKSFRRILQNYRREGKSLVIVSHHASLYSELVDDIIVLKNGKILYNDRLEELMRGTQKFENSFILKTSDRLRANDTLRSLPDVQETYLSQKAVHVYLKNGKDLYPTLNLLSINGLKIKQIISKKPNLDKLIGEIINAH